MSRFTSFSFDSDDDDEIEEVDQQINDEKNQQSIKQPPSKLQNGSIKPIGKLINNQSKNSSPINSTNILRYTALIERKIKMLKYNPMDFVYGEKMETYKHIVLDIMQTAASQVQMDENWLTNQINERTNDEDEREDLQFIGNNIDELAQTAIYEAKLHNQSINLIANRIRRARIDEFQRIEEERTLKEAERLFPGKRKLFEARIIKKEEYSAPPSNNSNPELKKFLLHNDDDDIGDIFSKSPSPPPSPAPEMEEIDSWDANDNDVELKEEEEEKVKFTKYRDHPIADIVHRPKNDNIKLPTRRQELIQSITGHVQYKPENVQRQKGKPAAKYGNEQKKQMAGSKVNNKVKKARLQCKPAETSNVDTDNIDLELEDYLNGPSSPSPAELYCEYKRTTTMTVRNISPENKTNVKFGQIALNIKSCLKKSDGLKVKKKIKFVAKIVENEGKSKNNPEYSKHFYQPNDGQKTYKFTCILTSCENLQSEEMANCKMIPSSDHPIMIKFRVNPYKNRKSEQDQIKREIHNELVQQISKYSDTGHYHSRLFIMDSILTQLDKRIFKNMSTFNLKFPKMPNWFIEGLENWWTDNINRKIQQRFCYSKVFILLGMDLNVFYAAPDGLPNQLVFSFLTDLNNWFDQKIKYIQQNLKQNDWEKFTIELGKGEIDEQTNKPLPVFRRLFLNQKPQFVVITIPEVGDWTAFFHEFNEELRKFVANNSANFTLLDWAIELEQIEKVNPLLVATVEQRTAILIKRMHKDHAVLYI